MPASLAKVNHKKVLHEGENLKIIDTKSEKWSSGYFVDSYMLCLSDFIFEVALEFFELWLLAFQFCQLS